MSELSGKVILVTGAGSGIGKAVALRAAADGASVMVADLDPDRGAETVREIGSNGSASFVETDITRSADVERMLAATLETFGRLDGAVNNAGIIHPPAPITDLPEDQLDAVWAVNLKGTWLCLAAEARHMRDAGSGSIVNMASSGVGLRPRIGLAGYGTTKAGIIYMSKAAARELAADQVRVNALCPGPTQTPGADPMVEAVANVPMGRLGQSTDVAAAAVWLLSDDAGFVTGIALPVDGGEAL